MIRFLAHSEIDKTRWDNCIEKAHNSLVFGYSWLLDIAHPGWNALVKDDYQAVWMIPRSQKLGIQYALQPFFIRHSGIFSIHPLSKSEEMDFFQAVPKNIRLVKLQVFPSGIPEEWSSKTRVYQRLQMNGPIEKITKNYSQNTKRQIKKAENENLIITTCSPQIVVEAFQQNRGGELEIFSEKNYFDLTQMMQTLIDRKMGEAYKATDGSGAILGTGFFCFNQDTVTYLKGAVTKEGRDKGAMHFLFHQTISRFHSRYNFLDFGGSNIEGVARFNKSWGASDQAYVAVTRNRLPFFVRWMKRGV